MYNLYYKSDRYIRKMDYKGEFPPAYELYINDDLKFEKGVVTKVTIPYIIDINGEMMGLVTVHPNIAAKGIIMPTGVHYIPPYAREYTSTYLMNLGNEVYEHDQLDPIFIYAVMRNRNGELYKVDEVFEPFSERAACGGYEQYSIPRRY